MEPKRRKLFYIASPYSCKEKDATQERIDEVHRQRFEAVQRATVDLTINYGVYIFSPIAYNHPMVKFNLPTDWGFWEEYDKAFIDHCDGLIVFQLEGWDESTGVAAEIEYAKELGLPVIYISPEQVFTGDVKELLKLNEV